MKNKEFKLLIEGFNNFLMSESDSKSDEDTQKLCDAVPSEFKKYVNRDIGWINGSAWLKEFRKDEALFEKLAKAFKCEVEAEAGVKVEVEVEDIVKDFLVINKDHFFDSVEYDGLDPDPFLASFKTEPEPEPEPRSFEIEGDFLKGKGFFVIKGVFLKGYCDTETIIVVPKLSGTIAIKSQDTEVDRKNKLK